MKTGVELIEEMQSCGVGQRSAAFWWLGQHSFVIKLGAAVCYLDPFLSDLSGRRVPPLLKAAEVTNATLVFGSHDHADHIDRGAWPDIAQASPQAIFVVPALLRNRVIREIGLPPERVIGVDTGLPAAIGSISITAVPAAHEMLERDPATGLHPYLGFIVEGNGFRLYHAGDTCMYEGMRALLKRWPLDLAFLPINGRDARRLASNCIGNMTFQEAADLSGVIQPGLTVPAHFEMFAGNTEDPQLFADYMRVKYPRLGVHVPRHGELVKVEAVHGANGSAPPVSAHARKGVHVAGSRLWGKSGGPKVTFIGGGSAKFVSQLTVDMFLYEELQNARICLMDVHDERLGRAGRLIRKIIQDRNLPATLETFADQRRALEGSDYVINTIMVGGFDHYKSDGEIPCKYGVLPTVGDTIGPGAVFRLIRTAPVLREIVANLRAVAPDAWLLNYANPMAMNTWTLLEEGHERTLGLCHSIQCAYREIAKWLGLSPEGMTYTAGGINHIDFYLTLEHEGRNVYPLLLQNKERILREAPQARARFELLEYLGYWPAEGDWHQNEYYPWFRKNEAMARDYATETMWGYRVDLENAGNRQRTVEEQLAGRSPVSYQRSNEYGAGIIHALETNTPSMFYGNIRNNGLIENLPPQAVVEVPCHADAGGVVAERVGRIPTQLAAVMTPHILVHEMAVEGVRRKSRTLIRQAIQADPLTGAVLGLPQIRALTDELMAANREYLRDWPEEKAI